MSSQREIRLNAFDMNCVGHQSPGLWAHPLIALGSIKIWSTGWIRRGCWSAASSTGCLSPTLGIYDVLNGSGDAAIRQRRRFRSTIRWL